MTYQIKFSKAAARFFHKLPVDQQQRVKERFRMIAETPTRYLEHFEGDYYKIRIGQLRCSSILISRSRSSSFRCWTNAEGFTNELFGFGRDRLSIATIFIKSACLYL